MLYTNKINYLDTHLPIFEISILATEKSKYYGKDQTCGIQYTIHQRIATTKLQNFSRYHYFLGIFTFVT